MEQSTPALSHIFRATGAGPKERGRLDATLARVGELYQALRGGGSVDWSTALAELRVDLALHFAREEGDEYFGSVQRDRPSLGHEIEKLRRDHALLLDELDAVRSLAADPSRSSEVGSKLLRLITAFRLHEYKEADLLQEAVLRDDGIGPD